MLLLLKVFCCIWLVQEYNLLALFKTLFPAADSQSFPFLVLAGCHCTLPTTPPPWLLCSTDFRDS